MSTELSPNKKQTAVWNCQNLKWYKDRRHERACLLFLLYNKKKAVVEMRKDYTFHIKEEKLKIVKRYLAGESPVKLHEETGISDGNIRKWKRQYLAGGGEALENKKKPGNPLSKYERRKELSREEQLEYQVELLKRELLKKDAEVVRLKKSIELEGGDIRRK